MLTLLAGFFDNLNPLNWVKYLADGAYKGIKRLLCWFVDQGLQWMQVAVDFVLGFFPDIPPELGVAVDWLGFIVFYFPVKDVLWCTFTYLMLCGVIAGFRFVKSFIPTLGG